jgi:uncharacterized protein
MVLRWDGGYGQVGPSIEHEGGREVRELTVLDGDPPPVGTRVVDVDSFAFPPDPARIGLDLETVTYPSPLGELEAWQLPGEGSTWIIAVHGGGADRHEFLRAVDATESLAYPMLLVRYRNDPGMPVTPGSLLLVGQEEWEDVAAAVEYALANGATDVVLHGASMGGALVLGYLVEGDASVVRGAILEAPNADIRDTIRLRAGEALPIGGPVGASLLAAGRAVVSLRTGLDFDAVDYVARARGLRGHARGVPGTDRAQLTRTDAPGQRPRRRCMAPRTRVLVLNAASMARSAADRAGGSSPTCRANDRPS